MTRAVNCGNSRLRIETAASVSSVRAIAGASRDYGGIGALIAPPTTR
jgi:hypothetical protein